MKYYTGDVKNPVDLRCRSCEVVSVLEKRTVVDSDTPMHFGTCPRCNTRWQHQYGRMERCEIQSHEFNANEISTWHLADQKTCTHHDHESRKDGDKFYPHYFHFPFYLKQNVWNPMQPQCKRCGVSIREIILEVLPRLREALELIGGNRVHARCGEYVHTAMSRVAREALATQEKDKEASGD